MFKSNVHIASNVHMYRFFRNISTPGNFFFVTQNHGTPTEYEAYTCETNGDMREHSDRHNHKLFYSVDLQ